MNEECKYGIPLNLHYPGNCLNCEIDTLRAKLDKAVEQLTVWSSWEYWDEHDLLSPHEEIAKLLKELESQP